MERPTSKVFLVVGTHGCGKTALAKRILEGKWTEPKPTIGLDQSLGSLNVRPDAERLRDDLLVLLPEGGIDVQLWEIGGKDCKHRAAPRGQPVNGLILCYDVGDRSSFHTAAHFLCQHRSDRHFAYESASVAAARADVMPRLVVVLCGTKADEADEAGGPVVTTSEQLRFVESSGVSGAFVTSAKTGEGAEEAFQALLLASLEAEEEAEVSRLLTASKPPAGEMFSLASPNSLTGPDGARDLKSMSSPRGLRPHEPSKGQVAADVVEVIDHHGTPYGSRPLSTCLELGLLHRVSHVWLCDPRNGGLLLRRYSTLAAKEPGLWGPSARGEVLCYEKDSRGPQSAELSFDTARRVLREQLGYEREGVGQRHIEHWGSATRRHGNIHERVEIYAVDIGLDGLPDFQLRRDEGVEWVHFTDVFSRSGDQASQLFHLDSAYRAAMVQKMRVRVEHAHSADGLPPIGLARDRPHCDLPIVASKHLQMTRA